MPPWLICVFFMEMPPKLTTRRCALARLDGRHLVHQLQGCHAEHMGDDHLGRAGGVGLDGVRIAGELTEKAMQLALRMVKTTGARPAIRAAESRLRGRAWRPPASAHPPPCPAPRPRARRRTARRRVWCHRSCPAASDSPRGCRSRNAAPGVLRGEQGLADRGGLRVVPLRMNGHDPAVPRVSTSKLPQ